MDAAERKLRKQQPRLTLRLERIDHPGQPDDGHAEHFEGRVARRAVAADLEVGVLGLDVPGLALARLAATRREAPLLEAVGLPAGLGDLLARHAEPAGPGLELRVVEHALHRHDVELCEPRDEGVGAFSEPHVAARDTPLRRVAEGDPVGRERAIALSDLDRAVGDVEVSGAIVFDGVRAELEGFVAGVELDAAQLRTEGRGGPRDARDPRRRAAPQPAPPSTAAPRYQTRSGWVKHRWQRSRADCKRSAQRGEAERSTGGAGYARTVTRWHGGAGHARAVTR